MEFTAPQSGAGSRLSALIEQRILGFTSLADDGDRTDLGLRAILVDEGRRVVFIETVAAQALGTVIGGGLLFLAGLAAGLIGDVPLTGLASGVAVIAIGLLLLLRGASKTEQVAARWEAKAKERIVREVEEKLRPMTPKERLRFFVPNPGGFARPPWMLDGLKEPFRQEVNDSLLHARREEGEEV